ncbi:MAG TPA: tripartite tricarboxylate transporter substrate binding protein [Ramlibacter sp.]|nr:tripartite tricarboxylate transporter substrate binding protein [Ramlibacter sp.]
MPVARRIVLAAAALTLCVPAAFAQAYPNRPVRIIVPQPPGGGFDTVGRLVADRMARVTGQSFVVENRTGSGTLVGTDLAAKAPADGYTLLVGSISNLALNPGLYANLPYDSLRDFEPVGLLVSYSYTLVGRKDLPMNSLQEVLAHAKANPGKLNYASAGNGSGQHVLAAALWHLAKVDVSHVPYRGAQPAYQDLLGGRVDLFFDLSPTARVQVDAATRRPSPCPAPRAMRCIRKCRPSARPVRRNSNSNPGSACSPRRRRRRKCCKNCAPTSRRSPHCPTCRKRCSRVAASPWPWSATMRAAWCRTTSSNGPRSSGRSRSAPNDPFPLQ